MSNGRLILGSGSDWFNKDYTEHAHDVEMKGSRVRDLDAGVGDEAMLRIVAGHAVLQHTSIDPKTQAHESMALDGWCAEAYRDPSTVE